MSIIGISGKAGSGKDQVGKFIKQKATYHWEVKKFAYRVKQITSLMTGVSMELLEHQKGKQMTLPEWGMTVREFLQKLATEAIRENLHEDAWVLSLFSEYISDIDSKWIITDLRFKNELKFLKSKDAITLRIERPGIPTMDHRSETDLDTSAFNYIIVNDGTLDDLKEKVNLFLEKFNIE